MSYIFSWLLLCRCLHITWRRPFLFCRLLQKTSASSWKSTKSYVLLKKNISLTRSYHIHVTGSYGKLRLYSKCYLANKLAFTVKGTLIRSQKIIYEPMSYLVPDDNKHFKINAKWFSILLKKLADKLLEQHGVVVSMPGLWSNDWTMS